MDMPSTRRLSGLSVVLAAVLGFGFGSGAAAQGRTTIDLDFQPPKIAPQSVCVSPPTDDETTDFWGHWDGRVLPDRPMRSIRRDITRLTQIDGVAWFETTARAMDLLERFDPAFTGQTALLLRIAALDAAGKFNVLSTSGLIARLADLGPALSPAGKMVLSRYVRDGIGIAADPAGADALLMDAGYSGDPKALLALAERQLAGEAPAGWSVPAELAVITAFGNTVGELDPTICDRTMRIAAQFRQGHIVTADPQLAHDWYRFTADLGSGHAAWKVVEYHMRAEGFAKSNDLLLRYLEQAAAAELSYAQIELGRVLERGALAPKDLPRAHALFEAASLSGDRRGLSQFALFLRRQEADNPSYRPRRLAVLKQLIARADAPGWAFAQLAEAVLQDQGRWAGMDIARDLLQEAVARGNLDGHLMLARLILADGPDAAGLDRAVDLLTHLVNERGGAQPMMMLSSALVCRTPDTPDPVTAAYWRDRAKAIGVGDSAHGAGPLLGLRIRTDGARLAEIQTYAISGSPDGLAMWRRVIEQAPFADDAMRQFWATYFVETDARLVARAKLDLTLTQKPGGHDVIFAALRERHRSAGPDFAGLLNHALMDGMYGREAMAKMAPETRAAALELLGQSAALGYGRAMLALAALSGDAAERQSIYARFNSVIDADGDFAAQLFAAVQSNSPEYYMARAAGIMPCNFGAAIEMAAMSEELGDAAATARWLKVAGVFAEERTSQMITLARAYLRGGDAADFPRALDLLIEASLRGDPRGDAEMFRLRATPGTPIYDPIGAAGMIIVARDAGRSEALGLYLSAYRNADSATREMIASRLDMDQVYRVAAEGGDPVAMRVHGLVLRENAAQLSDLKAAMFWLARAAMAEDTIAMTEYGQALAFGIGVPVDRALALSWLERAARKGSERAAEITRLVGLSGAPGQ